MDFTLSLAHFCELHGPTTLLCTQTLPVECSTCLPLCNSSTSSSPAFEAEESHEASSYFLSPTRPTSSGAGAFPAGDGDRCASCRISLPDEAQPRSPLKRVKSDRPALRTREEIHVCSGEDATFDGPSPKLSNRALGVSHGPKSNHSDASCHNHRLVYVSSSSPAESETFSGLRRATVRTLSGEQLPRGQTSGPLWFGDSATGYTIAYVFRLADVHARGRQRYYALLALAGSDTTRAFEACTTIWNLFEQIAMHIVRSAEAVAHRSSPFEESPPTHGTITPVSSFLTGRNVDPDGFPRRGMASVRANGIADLVENENFFCELHMIFVSMLQELGRMLGGMKVRPAELGSVRAAYANGAAASSADSTIDEEDVNEICGDETEPSSPHSKFTVPTDTDPDPASMYDASLYSPSYVDRRQQLVV